LPEEYELGHLNKLDLCKGGNDERGGGREGRQDSLASITEKARRSRTERSESALAMVILEC